VLSCTSLLNSYPLIKEYLEFCNHLVSQNGLVTATKVLKDLDFRVKLVAINQKLERKPYGGVWIKTSSDGLPIRLRLLRKALREDAKAVIQITSLVRLVKLPPSYDISTITSKGTATWPPIWIDEFTHFLDKHVKPVTIHPGEWHASSKAGPNGPAVISSAFDALSLNSMD
jgi:hypothetical protein